jgi:hypothetical protein
MTAKNTSATTPPSAMLPYFYPPFSCIFLENCSVSHCSPVPPSVARRSTPCVLLYTWRPRGLSCNSFLCRSVNSCFYTYIYNLYILKLHLTMRVFACNVVSKLQRNLCITFGDWRSRTNWPLHFYIYRYT